MKKQTPETALVDAICTYLEYKHYFFWRQNTTGVWDAQKKIYRQMSKWSRKGVADIALVVQGKAVFIEAKVGTKQSSDQIEFQRLVEENGGVYILAHTLHDVSCIL